MDRHDPVDIAVLGGGPAGYVAALRAAQLGASVALIEERELGGTCLNRGCIPTKALLRSAQVASLLATSKQFGIHASLEGIDWPTIFGRKDRVVKRLRTGVEHLLSRGKVQVLSGRGTFLGPNRLRVENGAGEQIVNARKIILATGSCPSLPPIPGIELENVITSDEALALPAPPESVLVIGAGVIGIEFSAFFRALGIPVTVVEQCEQILPGTDPDAAAELTRALKRQGVKFHLSSSVQAIKSAAAGLQVTLQDEKNNARQFEVSHVLAATGRQLRSDEAGLPESGLAIERGAVVVDAHMRTSLPDTYAAGDLVGGQLLAHVGYLEGRVAVENALGHNRAIDYTAIPACIYSWPELAQVGLSEQQAKERGISVAVGRFDFRANGKALGLGDRDGFVKVIVDRDSETVLGGVILGAEATELISELVLAVQAKIPASVLAELVYPHPTLSEAVMEAAADAIGRAIHK